MSDQLVVEREGLQKKEKAELQAIVQALGGTSTSRARKSDLIDQILELSGVTASAASSNAPQPEPAGEPEGEPGSSAGGATDASAEGATETSAEGATETSAGSDVGESPVRDSGDEPKSEQASAKSKDRQSGGRGRNSRSGRSGSGSHPVGSDGEPLADWEVEMLEDGETKGRQPRRQRDRSGGRGNDASAGNGQTAKNGDEKSDGQRGRRGRNQDAKSNDGKAQESRQDNRSEDADPGDEDEASNRKSRRRSRNRKTDRDDATSEPIISEPVEVEGFLDLREEGYAFLRVNGFLPSREDAYVSVKQVRQHGLRKGDRVTGLSRAANRNEKNPALQQVLTINGAEPDDARVRPEFDRLTALFPDEQLVLERKGEPEALTPRIIDLLAPIGKGQRGLVVSPPKAGKTTLLKDLARSIETNNPEVELIVLLIDERPEEITDVERHLERGEVVASAFDRPPEEHTAVAELTLERAKRRVEAGADVCLLVDGITRLARAYNVVAPATGRVLTGGVDVAAIYPPKRFMGAARKVEEGGSLTIVATMLSETGSEMDAVLYEEFKGTGNMQIRLDRPMAERGLFPALNIEETWTRRDESLLDAKTIELVAGLRNELAALAEPNSGAGVNEAGIRSLVEGLKATASNADFIKKLK